VIPPASRNAALSCNGWSLCFVGPYCRGRADRAPAPGLTFAALGSVNTPASPKVLVVFFSRTGTTRCVAENIARATHADIEEIREPRTRRGIMGWLRSGYEGTYRRSAPILPLQRSPQQYDLVYVGSPTWNRALASPVRQFLTDYANALPKVALFATCEGRGATDAIAQMTEILARPPLATLPMLERDVKHGPAVQVGEFVEAALTAWEREQRP
jgi:flavodoxin